MIFSREKKRIVLPNGRELNFTYEELSCKHCGMFNYHPGVLGKIQDVREEYHRPMTPTSGCRCAVHNKAVGGKVNSFHICDELPQKHIGQLGCMSIDVAAPDGKAMGDLAAIFWKHGFTVGYNWNKRFLHADQRIMLPGWYQTTFPY